jgi:hypothetical protein
MRLTAKTLQEISDGVRPAADAEVTAMARELLAMRNEEERHGTVEVTVQHVGERPVSGWFQPHTLHLPPAALTVGRRITLGGRIYSVVSIDSAGDVPSVSVR